MNASNVEHAGWAVAMQVLIGLLTGNWLAGAAWGAAWFISREHAQRQYRLVAGGSVKGLEPWEGLDFWDWSKDAQYDALFPLIACGLVYAAARCL